jgi:hypothetical protein
MNTPYSELIHRYLDGELPLDQQQQIFDELARNEELRREFGAELELHKAATSDMSAIIPPDTIRTSVFAALDIPSSSTTPEIVKAMAATSQSTAYAKVVYASMVVFSAAVWLVLRTYTPNDSITSQTQHTKAHPSSIATIESSSTPIIGNSKTTVIPRTNEVIERKSSMFETMAKAEHFTMNSELLSPSTTTFSPMPIRKTQYLPINLMQERIISLSSPTARLRQIPIDNEQLSDVPFYVQVQGITSIGQSYNTKSYTLAAMYESGENQSFGIELYVDNYSRTESRKVNGVETSFSFKEQFTAIGASYRLTLPSVSVGQFVPFVQSFAGATSNGLPIARTSIGIEWTPDSRITLSGGIGAAAIGFRANGEWKTASTVNVIYGMNVIL